MILGSALRFAGALLVCAVTVQAAQAAQALEVERVVSPGGIEAWLVQDTSNPILSVEFSFRGGAAVEPEGREGLATMVAALLTEGAGDLDSQTYREALADRSIDISFSAGRDSFSGSLTTLTRHREAAFDLLRLALTAPRFDEEPVERVRSQLQTRLARQSEDPGSIAWRSLMKLMFPDDPYGRPSDGTVESLAAIDRADLRGYLQDSLSRERLFIGVSGDIEAQALGRLLDEAFLDLPTELRASGLPPARIDTSGGVLVIERDQPQSRVALAAPGLLRADPDYYAALVVNHILGGGSFTSRLFQELRERRGLVYSVSTSLSPLERAGLITGGLATENSRVGESLALLREEWRRVSQEGPSAAELADAKTYLTGSFPLNLSSTGRIASILVSMQVNDLGIGHLNERAELINAVTLEDARRVAARYFDSDSMTLVVVGRPVDVVSTRQPAGAM